LGGGRVKIWTGPNVGEVDNKTSNIALLYLILLRNTCIYIK